jgi:signal transduction histidine kinase
VNDTLDFAQMQAGKFKMNYENINIRELTQDVCRLINVQLRLKEQVYLIDSVTSEVPETMETDSQRLKQILINLLRNSTKFTFKGFI